MGMGMGMGMSNNSGKQGAVLAVTSSFDATPGPQSKPNNMFYQYYFLILWWWWAALILVSFFGIVYRLVQICVPQFGR